MPAQLTAYTRDQHQVPQKPQDDLNEERLKVILGLIREQTGHGEMSNAFAPLDGKWKLWQFNRKQQGKVRALPQGGDELRPTGGRQVESQPQSRFELTGRMLLLEYEDLEKNARKVFQVLVLKESEVKGEGDLWFQVNILPYRTVDNKIDGVVLIFADIRRLKKTELSLTSTELRFQALMEEVDEGVVLLDAASGKIAEANPAFCRKFGRQEQEVVGKKLWDLAARGHGQQSRRMVEAAGRDEQSGDLVLAHDGGRRTLPFTARLIGCPDRTCIQAITRENSHQE